mmetsp:Transcript_4606/g.14922  ORF Transcript_4606/g.14922 Transcript_4606/m.14922 type:complete len:290 (-) Transcript_4606:101-970(-)
MIASRSLVTAQSRRTSDSRCGSARSCAAEVGVSTIDRRCSVVSGCPSVVGRSGMGARVNRDGASDNVCSCDRAARVAESDALAVELECHHRLRSVSPTRRASCSYPTGPTMPPSDRLRRFGSPNRMAMSSSRRNDATTSVCRVAASGRRSRAAPASRWHERSERLRRLMRLRRSRRLVVSPAGPPSISSSCNCVRCRRWASGRTRRRPPCTTRRRRWPSLPTAAKSTGRMRHCRSSSCSRVSATSTSKETSQSDSWERVRWVSQRRATRKAQPRVKPARVTCGAPARRT